MAFILVSVYIFIPIPLILQIAEEHKAYAEGKDEEVKVLERSIEELENTVCALESKVSCTAFFI